MTTGKIGTATTQRLSMTNSLMKSTGPNPNHKSTEETAKPKPASQRNTICTQTSKKERSITTRCTTKN